MNLLRNFNDHNGIDFDHSQRSQIFKCFTRCDDPACKDPAPILHSYLYFAVLIIEMFIQMSEWYANDLPIYIVLECREYFSGSHNTHLSLNEFLHIDKGKTHVLFKKSRDL